MSTGSHSLPRAQSRRHSFLIVLQRLHRLERLAQVLLDFFVPAPIQSDNEALRRARLFVGFSILGFISGLLFGGFYILIGHPWGGFVVLFCTGGMGLTLCIISRVGVAVAGNLYAMFLTGGFIALTSMEGGVHGHAIAWLATVPLCTCILVGRKSCWAWCLVCFIAISVFCLLEHRGIVVPTLYPANWAPTVTAAGFISLTLFMSALGLIHEQSRRRALAKINETLADLSDANARLRQLHQERSEFLNIAAHDLRSPLTSIVGFTQLFQLRLSNLGSDQACLDDLDRILTSASRMRDLLDNLLSVGAIEEGRLELTLEECDLAQAAAGVIQVYRDSADRKRIAIHFDAPSALVQVRAHGQALRQVIDNLVSNAVKYTPLSRSIFIRVERRSECATLEVEDQGPGLTAEDQSKLYQQFGRLSAKPTAGESSHGLGLSIVKRLTEAMGGRVACRSRPGAGATFSITLPACGEAPAAPGQEDWLQEDRLRMNPRKSSLAKAWGSTD